MITPDRIEAWRRAGAVAGTHGSPSGNALLDACSEIERLQRQLDQSEASALDVVDERDRCERKLDQFAYTIAPIEVIGEHSSGNDPWENALDMLSSAAQVEELEADRDRAREIAVALEQENARIRELHSPYKIYDECSHRHAETDPGVTVVTHVGPTCEDGYLYTICRHCCTDALGDQTEACATEHDHATSPCPTSAVFDGGEAL